MGSHFPSDDHGETQESVELLVQRWMSIQHRQELATCIAHDLVQPLSEIVNRVWLCREWCTRAEESSPLHESLDEIENCALRSVEMIRMAHKLVGTKIRRESSRDCREPGDTVS